LAGIPILILLDKTPVAKLLGIFVVVLFSVALRRWLYLAKKHKGRAEKINLNANDRYFLEKEVAFYQELSGDGKRIFEDRIALFLTDIIVTEIGKDIPERETCLLVASSAVITFWGLPYWNYGRLSEVLVYPTHFTEDNQLSPSGTVLGKVHHGGLMDTTMILSLPALKHGFRNQTDKKMLEFMNLLTCWTNPKDL
jgi:MtfA peptidase